MTLTAERLREWLDGYFGAWVLAVTGNRGIAHWNVTSRKPGAAAGDEWDGVLLLSFAEDGRCREHREWLSHRQSSSHDSRD